MALVSVTDAAGRLSVSSRRVQQLVRAGELQSPARGVVEAASVESYLAYRGEPGRRTWSEPTAWGAVAILAGDSPTWMGAPQRSRLKSRVRELSPADLVERSRGRARVLRFAGHRSAGDRLRSALVTTGDGAQSLGLVAVERVDGYLDPASLDEVARRYGLSRNDEGMFVLRTTTFDLDIVARLASEGTVLAALDLAGSLDVRERRAGLDGLTNVLEGMSG